MEATNGVHIQMSPSHWVRRALGWEYGHWKTLPCTEPNTITQMQMVLAANVCWYNVFDTKEVRTRICSINNKLHRSLCRTLHMLRTLNRSHDRHTAKHISTNEGDLQTGGKLPLVSTSMGIIAMLKCASPKPLSTWSSSTWIAQQLPWPALMQTHTTDAHTCNVQHACTPLHVAWPLMVFWGDHSSDGMYVCGSF